jgi:hypothetical protein
MVHSVGPYLSHGCEEFGSVGINHIVVMRVDKLQQELVNPTSTIQLFKPLFDRLVSLGESGTLVEKAKAKLLRLEEAGQKKLSSLDLSKVFNSLKEAVQLKDPLLIANQLIVLIQNGMESHPEAQSALKLEETLRADIQHTEK